MSASQNQRDETPKPPEKSSVILLLNTIGDTTWRMFVPIIGLTIGGLLADKQLHTTPWVMVLGIIIGTIIAGLLVRRQLKNVYDSK